MAKATDKGDSLKRLGGGRWQTRDERFTIEPQSGTWVVVDAEQTDELGLALVRGPFGSLGAAKEAIATARDNKPAASPLAQRAAKLGDRAAPAPARSKSDTEVASDKPAKGGTPTRAGVSAKATNPAAAQKSRESEDLPEPKWLQALGVADRRRAKRLIDRLTEAGATDAESIVRRDVVGDVPAAATFAIGRALEGLGKDASPAEVARLLADGRDEDLGVRWRLVDGDGRPVTLDIDALTRRQGR